VLPELSCGAAGEHRKGGFAARIHRAHRNGNTVSLDIKRLLRNGFYKVIVLLDMGHPLGGLNASAQVSKFKIDLF
jgi:hypothetical protein